MPVEDTGLFREWQRREPEELLGTDRDGETFGETTAGLRSGTISEISRQGPRLSEESREPSQIHDRLIPRTSCGDG